MSKQLHPNFNRRFINKSEVARQLGISRPYASMLINGQRNNPEMLAKIKALVKQELKAA